MSPAAFLSQSPALQGWLTTKSYPGGLASTTERELGWLLAMYAHDAVAVAEVLGEMRERGFVVAPGDVVKGGKVRASAAFLPSRGVVGVVGERRIVVAFFYRDSVTETEKTEWVTYTADDLRTGVLRHF